MTNTKTPNPETTPTLADCLAVIHAAPPPILVEIRDALRVMRDQLAAQVVDDRPGGK